MNMKSLLRYSACAIVLFVLTAPLHAADAGAEALEVEGLIGPSQTAELGAPLPGVLDRVLVERGDRVTAGQVVAHIKHSIEDAQIELERTRREFGHRKVKRNTPLYGKEYVSASDRDEQETEVKLAEAQLAEAIAKRDARIIKSPINGVVASRAKSAGEYIGEGVILTVACLDPLKVEVNVPQKHLGAIALGMRARIRPESAGAEVLEGEVTIVDPLVDAASGTFGVRLKLPNPSGSIHGGVKCKVQFLPGTAPDPTSSPRRRAAR